LRGRSSTAWAVTPVLFALLIIFLFLLFICAYNVRVISPPFPPPSPLPALLFFKNKISPVSLLKEHYKGIQPGNQEVRYWPGSWGRLKFWEFKNRLLSWKGPRRPGSGSSWGSAWG
jgi:hypothetical protein